MGLMRLPNEVLLDITSYLHTSDIYTLIRTSHDLYNALNNTLYYSDGRHNQADALCHAVKYNRISQVQSSLHGLRTAPRQYHTSPIRPCCHYLITELEWFEPVKVMNFEDELEKPICPVKYDEKEKRWSSCCSSGAYCKHFPRDFWQDFSKHPLYQDGYKIMSILNVQQSLLTAIRGRHFKLVELLLKHGAQTNFYFAEKRKWACHLPFFPRKWYWGIGITEPSLCVAVNSGDVEIVTLLLKYGAQPDLYPPSPLYLAVEKRKFEVIPTLLRHSVRPQGTALKLAVLREDICTVKYLLDEGLDAQEYGSSALYSAQMKGDQQMVDLLESRGAKLACDSFDKEKWAEEDNDGECLYFRQWWYFPETEGIDEDSTEDEGNY